MYAIYASSDMRPHHDARKPPPYDVFYAHNMIISCRDAGRLHLVGILSCLLLQCLHLGQALKLPLFLLECCFLLRCKIME